MATWYRLSGAGNVCFREWSFFQENPDSAVDARWERVIQLATLRRNLISFWLHVQTFKIVYVFGMKPGVWIGSAFAPKDVARNPKRAAAH